MKRVLWSVTIVLGAAGPTVVDAEDPSWSKTSALQANRGLNLLAERALFA